MARSFIFSEVFFALILDSAVKIPTYVGSARREVLFSCISPRLAILVFLSTVRVACF